MVVHIKWNLYLVPLAIPILIHICTVHKIIKYV
jgi:hypothetical protein